MRFRVAFASLVAILVPSAARADAMAPALVRVLDAPGRVHPLADATGKIPISVSIPRGTSASSLGLLEVAPGVGAIRLAPADVTAFAAAHPDLELGVGPRLRPLLDVSGAWTHIADFRAASGGIDGSGVIVGIVDTGVDVRHPDFLDKDGHTRIAWMLAPGAPRRLHPDLEDAYGCTDPKQSPCAVYSALDIDAVIRIQSDELGDHEGHGTHVASIAAGNGGPSVTATPKYVGVAPGATLVVAAPFKDGAFVDTDILNATRFIFDRASAMGMPAVANLSLGGDYGAHDGSSNLEKGLSALVGDDKPGRAIVVAAGNSGEVFELQNLPGPLGIHTEAHVTPGEVVRVPIYALSAMDGQGFVWITFRSGDDVEVALDGPGRSRWVGFVGRGGQGGYAHGSNQGGVINNLPSANAAQAGTNSASAVFTGQWDDASEFAVLLRGSGDASLWVAGQKDAAQGLYFEHALRQGTINVPATAPALLAVGCTVNRVEWTPLGGGTIGLSLGLDAHPSPDSACYFSAKGPTPFGVAKPEISAPGGFVAAAMSSDADPRKHPGGLFDIAGCPKGDPYCGVMDNYHAIAQGTSMSAPHVAGAIALLMKQDPTLTQARATEVLQAGARRPTAKLTDPDQLGPGELDIDGAWIALLDEMAAPVAPDVGRSWFTLSSAYARPDATWPVWGTIELRKSDGSIAGGVDGSQLSLAQRGGVLYQPLTHVRQGLWTFAIAGTPDDLAQGISIDVTYAGASLGARSLRVGNDAWSAEDPTLAAVGGGCTCELACDGDRRDGEARGAGLAVLAALAMGLRRRRRAL